MLFPTSLRLPRRLAGRCLFASLGLLLFLPAPLRAQTPPAGTFDATTLRQPTDLGFVWLIKAGDDPSYARADYDDTHWTRLDTNQSLKQIFPTQHPSVIWYRMHVKVAPNQAGLSLEEFNLSSAFEIYVNGERMFANGSVSPYQPYGFQARIVKPIPEAMIATGSVVIAMRL